MKVGDLVMFSAIDDRYAKWFFGEFAVVERTTNDSCRVRWNRPIEYYHRIATVSDFKQNRFTLVSDSV